MQTKVFKKNINREIGKIVRVIICAMRNNMLKIKSKYLIFKTSIAGVKTCLLIDNRSEAEFMDEFFVCANKTLTFELENLFDFIFRNSKIVEQSTKEILINIIIRNHIERIVYYLAKLNMYTVILGNKKLQMHSPIIN